MATSGVPPTTPPTAPSADDPASRRRSTPAVTALAGALVVLVAALMLWSQQRVPDPRPAESTPVTAFSAERAMRHVQRIASETRFQGSPHHARTQRYLQQQLRALGLQPQLQRAAVVNRFSDAADPEAGTVTNIVARIPGTASSGAIALNAHYDSGAGGPGASDCGSCVATVLETARALRAGAPLRNDVLLVFTDAEEDGDLGAAAFAASPLIRDVDVVLNWETTGSHGPSLLVGSNSSWLVEHVLAGTPHARTYSVQPSVLRGLFGPQQLNTDTQEYMDRGVAGVQMVYMRGTTDYHTVLDNPRRLDRGSLQMGGDYAVGLSRRLGDEELTRRTGDRATYFNVTGGVIVQYGPAVALLLALLTAALFVAASSAGLRGHRLTRRGLIAGALAFPLVTLATTVVTVLAWVGLKSAVPDLRVFSIGSDQNAFFVFGMLALALAVFCALYQPLGRRARVENLAIGALLWWVVLTVAFALLAPSAAYLWTWPALAAAAVALWRLSGERPAPARWAAGLSVPLAVLIVVYAPVMLFFTLLALRLDGLGLPAVGVMGFFVALAAGLLVPHLAPRVAGRRGLLGSHWLLPVTASALAVLLVGVGVARLGYDADFPRPDFISYVYDADTGRAVWEAGDRDSWSEPLLRDAERAEIELAPFSTVDGWRAPAPAVELAAPRLTRMSASTAGGTTTLRLRVRSLRDAGNVAAHLRASAPIVAATVEGESYPSTPGMRDGELKLPYVGLPREGITVELTLRGHGTVRAELSDVTQGLPAGANAPRRPRDTMPAALSFRADPTVVRSSTVVEF
jgi:hypothetical protein